MRIPAENLSAIVQYALQKLDDPKNLAGPEGQGTHSAGLSLLSGFSLASQIFRQVALREIFKKYHVTQASHLQCLDNFPDLYKWIRVLHCPVNLAIHIAEKQYARFMYLRCVHLWGSPYGLTSVLQRLPMSVQEMTLPFDHANDHASVLTSVSRLRNLKNLRVARSRFEVPPASEVPCADVPPHHYNYCTITARLFKPLDNLCSIQIDHYLTDTDVFDFHAGQCPWGSASSEFCPTCWEKFGEQTVNAEITCTKILARGLKSLESVMWKSWFTLNAEGYSRVFIAHEVGSEGDDGLRITREREVIEAKWINLTQSV